MEGSRLGPEDVRVTWSLLPLVSRGTRSEEGARGTPSIQSPPPPKEAPLTWEALPYGCPKCGKAMVAVPGSPSSSVACWRLSPRGPASVPYAAAGAQRRVLRPLGVTGGRAKGRPAAKPCALEGAPPAPEVRKTEGPMDEPGKGEDASSQRRAVARPGEARRGARLCGSGGVQGGQRLNVTSR